MPVVRSGGRDRKRGKVGKASGQDYRTAKPAFVRRVGRVGDMCETERACGSALREYPQRNGIGYCLPPRDFPTLQALPRNPLVLQGENTRIRRTRRQCRNPDIPPRHHRTDRDSFCKPNPQMPRPWYLGFAKLQPAMPHPCPRIRSPHHPSRATFRIPALGRTGFPRFPFHKGRFVQYFLPHRGLQGNARVLELDGSIAKNTRQE